MNSLRSIDSPLDAAIPASRSDVLKVAVGFSPRKAAPAFSRRVATLESLPLPHASLRDAAPVPPLSRGLKPMATFTASLCDGASVAGPASIPKGLCPPAQGWRAAPTLGTNARTLQPQRGCGAGVGGNDATPLGLKPFRAP